jgi:hypothetical protein
MRLSKVDKFLREQCEKDFESGRMSGKTTRIIDSLIQELFETGKCTCINEINNSKLNLFTMDRVLRRLELEHSFVKNELIVSKTNFTIEFK